MEILDNLIRKFEEKLQIDILIIKHEEYYNTVDKKDKEDKLNDIIDEFQSS